MRPATMTAEKRKNAVVGYDTTDLGCSKENIFRPLGGKELFNLLLTAQVKLAVRACYDVCVTLTLQFAHYGGAYHSAVSCYIYF